MGDLFSQCSCVHTYVSVTLRNINLQYRLGMNLRSRLGRISDTTCIVWTGSKTIPRALHDDVGTRFFLATEDGAGEDSAAGPLQHTYLTESSAEASAECSRQLATLTKNNQVHHRSQESKKKSQESKKKTKKSSTIENTYILEILHKPGIYSCFVLLFGLPLNEQRLTPAPCAPSGHCAWSGARHHTHAYS